MIDRPHQKVRTARDAASRAVRTIYAIVRNIYTYLSAVTSPIIKFMHTCMALQYKPTLISSLVVSVCRYGSSSYRNIHNHYIMFVPHTDTYTMHISAVPHNPLSTRPSSVVPVLDSFSARV